MNPRIKNRIFSNFIYMKNLILFFLIIWYSSLYAQKMEANYQLANKYTISKLNEKYNPKKVSPYWISKNSEFIYCVKQGDSIDVFYVNPKKAEKQKLTLQIDKIDDSNFIFQVDSVKYIYNQFLNSINIFSETPFEISENNFSPNNLYSVYCKNNNLYFVDNRSQANMQLSFDGEKFYSFNGNIDYLYTNELNNEDTLIQPPSITWSKKSEYFVAFRKDSRELEDNWVINSITEPRPSLITFKQRNPKEKKSKDEIWIYNIENNMFFKADLKKWTGENYWFLGWSRNGEFFFIQRIDQTQTKCDILKVNKEGKYEVIITEKPSANIYPKEFIEIEDDKYLWFSRQDGWGHVYLYDNKRKKIKQLTKGKFNVDKIVSVAGSYIYFLAKGKEKEVNPYYSLFYKIDINNKEIKPLSSENAEHEIIISPNSEYYIDIYSRVDQSHKSVLKDTEGNSILLLEEADKLELEKSDWQNPQIFKVMATDSITNLWGVMWKPFDFNPEKKYPVITFVYPGPQHNFVPVEFFQGLNNAHLAQYGFIVVMCDTRGSSYGRSVEFSEYFRTNIRDYPIGDNKFMIEQLAYRHSFIDIDRVGIWGGSSGGFMTATAMLKYPEFYKVGVSRAGQHDPNIFHGWWTDVFNSEVNIGVNDTIYTNTSLVKNLKGKLLIIHGEIDTNVHPSNSARLVNELMKAGKYFDYLVVPGGDHGWSENRKYVQKRVWLYFVENLMDNKIDNIEIMNY